jgi:phosphoribosylformimino-5-aminoimidazole carboxamide ribonucleotide (ProFAR) isomerase
MDKWQTMTDMNVNKESLNILAKYCSEFLVHAADVEGLCKGIDEDLVKGNSYIYSMRSLTVKLPEPCLTFYYLHKNSAG